ncbi:MAG: 6-carboxytetrahydropterin synthase QueD [Candidatus Omnitrophica bacterium]|nr:6-carboxytetrahydropterin synthase QueD [Candidatus Omnitrophota bacterium]
MFELTVQDRISSAHFLRGYNGPCQDLHGHTWKIEVVLLSSQLNELGLVMDFRELKVKLKDFLKPLDHVCLNELPSFKDVNPSTENLAQYIYRGFSKACVPLKLKQVRVWESEITSIIYYE